MPRVTLTLTSAEAAELRKSIKGSGGWQSLARQLQAQLDPMTNQIGLTDAQVGRIIRYMMPGPGGFERRLHDAFQRSILDALNSA